MGILNTMDKEIISAKTLLKGTGISLLDAARLVRNILDALPKNSSIVPIHFCSKVIEVGKHNIRSKEMRFSEGFFLYLQTKGNLRPDSIRDIRYLGKRLIKSNPGLSKCNFSEFSVSECEKWLSQTFSTPSQFNKARTMLHGLFEFALRREWCDKNPVKLIERRRIIEKEISPLTFPQIKNLLKTAKMPKHKECLPAIGLLMFAGVRPREVHRLTWKDIDLEENSITIHSLCSKTGGVRQVEICSSLKRLLAPFANGQMKGYAQKTGKNVGGILGMTLALKTCGFKIFCAIPTQATMQNALKTFRVYKSIWGIMTFRSCVPDM